jgi:predicted ATPase
LTVFAGPNGSGKSTLFDVFAFLAECFDEGLRRAWDRRGGRGGGREIRSRGSEGPVEFEIKYRESKLAPIAYQLTIDDGPRGPIVVSESLRWRHGKRSGRSFAFLDFHRGAGA